MSRTFIIIDRPLANLLIRTLFCIWRWAVWFRCVPFQVGCRVPRGKIKDLWEGIFPGFPLVSKKTLDLFDILHPLACWYWLPEG